MDLPALRAVVAVAEELHFGRAAQRLGIAQPQVSQRVRRLEDELDLAIFERSHHRVRLTEAGHSVVDLAAEIVAGSRRLDRLATGLREGSQGTVVLGAVGSAFFGPLTQLLAPCREALPDVRIHVREMETPAQLAALRQGEIDLGLLRPPPPPGVAADVVWSEPLVVAVHADNPLAGRASLAVSDLVDEDLVFFSRESGPGYWDRVSSIFDAAGVALDPVAEAEHVTTLLGLVSLGMGLTFVPQTARTIELPQVAYVPFHDAPQLELALVSPTGHLAPATRMLKEAIAGEPPGSA